jgi:hypothetical protein
MPWGSDDEGDKPTPDAKGEDEDNLNPEPEAKVTKLLFFCFIFIV